MAKKDQFTSKTNANNKNSETLWGDQARSRKCMLADTRNCGKSAILTSASHARTYKKQRQVKVSITHVNTKKI
jgi:hypothetical protein